MPTDVDAFSVDEFCRRHGISRPMFYKLCRQGHGPRTMKIGVRTLVSVAAAEEWRRQMEAASQAA